MSVESNFKSDLLEGEGKLWDPNLSQGREIKVVYKRGGHAPCSCHVTQKCMTVTLYVDVDNCSARRGGLRTRCWPVRANTKTTERGGRGGESVVCELKQFYTY
jgi:hypothetical protein